MIASTICLATRAKSSVVVAYASCPCQGGGKGPETTVAPLEEVVPGGEGEGPGGGRRRGGRRGKLPPLGVAPRGRTGVGRWGGLRS